jgi:hypothetical protein
MNRSCADVSCYICRGRTCYCTSTDANKCQMCRPGCKLGKCSVSCQRHMVDDALSEPSKTKNAHTLTDRHICMMCMRPTCCQCRGYVDPAVRHKEHSLQFCMSCMDSMFQQPYTPSSFR